MPESTEFPVLCGDEEATTDCACGGRADAAPIQAGALQNAIFLHSIVSVADRAGRIVEAPVAASHARLIPTDELRMMPELIPRLPGVCRECITDAAGRLQNAGLIRYRRGHISMLNRAELGSHSCECYGVVKTELNRLRPLAMLTQGNSA